MIEPPKTEFAIALRVEIGPAVSLGETALGRQRFIPILGGSVEGPAIAGEVIPGGADWQTTRADGVTLVEAIYAIRTTDGAVINVRNRGLVAPVKGGGRHVRTTPQFEAPRGPHDWLNRNTFVGTIDLAEGAPPAVMIRVFRVL